MEGSFLVCVSVWILHQAHITRNGLVDKSSGLYEDASMRPLDRHAPEEVKGEKRERETEYAEGCETPRGCGPTEACVRLEHRAQGGELALLGVICHCLMRLMSPEGWYAEGAGALIRSRCSWERTGQLSSQVVSINLWAGPRVRPGALSLHSVLVPTNTGEG